MPQDGTEPKTVAAGGASAGVAAAAAVGSETAPVANAGRKSVEKLKEEGNVAFKRAQLLRKTTAGKQYLAEAKACYIEAIQKLGGEAVTDTSMALICTLHSNLAMVFLSETPPKYPEAKASAEIALAVQPRHVKALYRRAQAWLEDEREGLPEANLRAALVDLDSALEAEPHNEQLTREAARVRRRLAAIEAARRVPPPVELAARVPGPLLDRGGDCLAPHGYVWGQTEALVHVFVPARGARLARAAEAVVEVRPRFLRIALPDVAGPPAFELSGQLRKPVRPDDCSWQLEEDGLLLHVELAKRVLDEDADKLEDEQGEHWSCVWRGHPETNAPTAKERRRLQEMACAANRAEAKEAPEQPLGSKQSEALRRMRELCPGVNVEWGDTSLDSFS